MTIDEQRGWRVGHQGRDQMYYEELHQGAWKRIEIDGEMLMGRAHPCHLLRDAGTVARVSAVGARPPCRDHRSNHERVP
jgi:hypothetical protein